MADESPDVVQRLMARFGDPAERKWATEPDGPRLLAGDLIGRVLTARTVGGRMSGEKRVLVEADDVTDALTLVEEARRDADNRELGILTAARDLGLTWRQIAAAVGLDSPQAAQQRWERLLGRAKTGRVN